jgi:hypothetical protein
MIPSTLQNWVDRFVGYFKNQYHNGSYIPLVRWGMRLTRKGRTILDHNLQNSDLTLKIKIAYFYLRDIIIIVHFQCLPALSNSLLSST